MSEPVKGVLAVVLACTIWGLSGLFFRAIAQVPPAEVLAHRVIWSVAFLGAVLVAQGRLGELAEAARRGRNWAVLCTTSLLIAANWFGFVVAIQSGRGLEASLGYYVFPLVAIALGYLVLGERFSRLQAAAIALALAAVAALTLGLGAPPWIALLLATTFGCYGLLKNRLGLGPVISVFFETAILAPLALVWLSGLHGGAWIDPSGRPGGFFLGDDPRTTVLLALSGPLMTGGPLILFSYAARRIRLATLGLVQYLNPTLQFVVAVLAFGETFTIWHAVAFPMIWAGLALYSWQAWRLDRAARRTKTSAKAR
jgi:chloramphenicol-sensitive protein RarD